MIFREAKNLLDPKVQQINHCSKEVNKANMEKFNLTHLSPENIVSPCPFPCPCPCPCLCPCHCPVSCPFPCLFPGPGPDPDPNPGPGFGSGPGSGPGLAPAPAPANLILGDVTLYSLLSLVAAMYKTCRHMEP